MYSNLTPEQYKQLNELLSMTTMSSKGEIDGQFNPQLADLMEVSPQAPAIAPMQQNYAQNYVQRSGGAPISLDYAAQPTQNVWADGPRLLNQEQLADGRTLRRVKVPVYDSEGRQSSGVQEQLVTPDYLNPAKLKELDYRKKLKDLEGTKLEGTWKEVDSGGKLYLVNSRTGEIKPAKTDGQQLWGKKGDVETAKDQGKRDVELTIAGLRDAYTRLSEGGGITDTSQSGLANLGAGIASSGVGQTAGKLFGTSNQSARNEIAMMRPSLMSAIMKATGMSSKQLDSNAELKLWLATATDPTLDIQANQKALDLIEEKYIGGGSAPTEPSAPTTAPTTAVTAPTTRTFKLGDRHNGYTYLGGDIKSPKSWKKEQ